LRDPDGLIWSDADLITYWNRALIEIVQNTLVLERADSYEYPSKFTWAVSQEWERGYADGDILPFGKYWEAGGMNSTYTWEASYWMESSTGPQAGYVITQPWESVHGKPDDILPVKLNDRHLRTIYIAHDQERVEGIQLQELGRIDPWYRTRTGFATHYYFWDETEMLIGLYPRPSQVTIDELDTEEVLSDTGGIVTWAEGSTEDSDTGWVTDTVDTQYKTFVIYVPYPPMTESVMDEVNYPTWCRHYLEAHVLEQAFGADTDGYIPSLENYWRARKELGIQVLKDLRIAAMKDRKIQMGPQGHKRIWKHPTLPSGYPRTDP
jgi:hypothetical protein